MRPLGTAGRNQERAALTLARCPRHVPAAPRKNACDVAGRMVRALSVTYNADGALVVSLLFGGTAGLGTRGCATRNVHPRPLPPTSPPLPERV